MDNHLEWRYATKKFDPVKKIAPADFTALLETLRLSPSSFGLQPWKFIVVTNDELRKTLKGHAWGQDQLTSASHLIVLCALKTMDEQYVKDFIVRVAQSRGVPAEALAGYEQMMLGFLKAKTPIEIRSWMERQVYIALGMLLSECAHRKIDACPMEGFDSKEFDKILGLSEQGLESIVLCAVGHRAADDSYAHAPKVRFEPNEVIQEKR